MLSKGEKGMEGGGAGADAVAMGVGDGEGESRGSNAANALGTIEMPMVELGLVGASGGEDDGVPGGNPGGMADGDAEMVPGLPQGRLQIGFASTPPPSPTSVPSAFHHLNPGGGNSN